MAEKPLYLIEPPGNSVTVDQVRELMGKFHSDIVEMHNDVSNLKVVDAKTANQGTFYVGHIAKLLKSADEARLDCTKSNRAFTEVINSAFNVHLINPLKAMKTIANNRVVNWRRDENRRIAIENEKREADERMQREEQLRQLRADSEVIKERDAPPAPPIVPVVVKRERDLDKLECGHTVTNYSFVVQDATLVHRDWMTVDMMKIGKAVRASHGQITIPGIRVTETKTIVGKR